MKAQDFSRHIDRVLKRKRRALVFKRAFDLIVSALALVLLALPLGLIAIIIKATSEGPVFFRQERIGKDGVPFKIFKFRSMVENAEALGMQITVGEDPRITRIGRFIRKTKLDELPQLINVFNGTMSFVGPRPEVARYVALYDNRQKNVLKIRPGITDLASIKYRSESEVLDRAEDPEYTYIHEIMPEKLELNLEYIENMSVSYDIGLILKTLVRIVG